MGARKRTEIVCLEHRSPSSNSINQYSYPRHSLQINTFVGLNMPLLTASTNHVLYRMEFPQTFFTVFVCIFVFIA